MVTRTEQLKKQIAELKAEQGALTNVGNARMSEAASKADNKLVDQAVEAFGKVEALESRIKVLQTALAAAEQIDKAEQAAAWRQEHRERIERVHTLADQRTKQAKAIDAAFSSLKGALEGWQVTSGEITDLVRNFAPARHLPEGVRIERMRALLENARGSNPAMAFALTQSLQRVLMDVGLLDAVDPYLSFTHVFADQRRRGATAADAAGKAAEQLRQRLVEKETTDD